MNTRKPQVPPSLNWAAIVGGLVGVLYMIAGLIAFADAAVAPVYVFFGLTGFAMLSGGIGLLAGRRWAREWATFGVGALLLVHGFVTIILLAAIVVAVPRPPDGIWLAAVTMVGLTSLLAWVFRQFRSDATQHFLWATEEAKIEVGAHEVPGASEQGEVLFEFSDEAEPIEATAEH